MIMTAAMFYPGQIVNHSQPLGVAASGQLGYLALADEVEGIVGGETGGFQLGQELSAADLSALKGQDIHLVGDGAGERDFVFVGREATVAVVQDQLDVGRGSHGGGRAAVSRRADSLVQYVT